MSVLTVDTNRLAVVRGRAMGRVAGSGPGGAQVAGSGGDPGFAGWIWIGGTILLLVLIYTASAKFANSLFK